MLHRLVALAYGLLAARVSFAAEPVDYLRDIKPILSAHVSACHGALRQKSGLRLDAAQLIQEGGDDGPVLIAGNSSGSSLIQRLLGTAGLKRMLPKEEGEALGDEKIALLKTWNDQEAHCAVQPPSMVIVCPVTFFASGLIR